ncbi:hypothetical protein HaLaN_18082 [Haematococcus lacustris]|uniref:Uncharacterized protein n=1 Tax=Haematococcus lacustris TaxID=44745 RepID=A0A699ZIG0_HAELA|nr:hypothetical protein HaLaN_18082 [Haematococcus lacustris]
MTFGWGEGGLDAALQLLQQKLEDRKEVLEKHLGGSGSLESGGLLMAGLQDKLTQLLPQFKRDSAFLGGSLREKLQAHMQGSGGVGSPGFEAFTFSQET